MRLVDVLKLVDPAKDAVRGDWRIVNGLLTSSPFPCATVEIPYEPPEEYDFRIVYVPVQDDTGGVLELCRGGDRQFCFVVGAQGNRLSGFETVNGRSIADIAASSTADHWLAAAERHVSLVRVRKGNVQGYLDGKLVAGRHTDFSDMGLLDIYSLPRPNTIGFGVYKGSIAVVSATVTEITGKGKLLDHFANRHHLRPRLRSLSRSSSIATAETKPRRNFVSIACRRRSQPRR